MKSPHTPKTPWRSSVNLFLVENVDGAFLMRTLRGRNLGVTVLCFNKEHINSALLMKWEIENTVFALIWLLNKKRKYECSKKSCHLIFKAITEIEN